MWEAKRLKSMPNILMLLLWRLGYGVGTEDKGHAGAGRRGTCIVNTNRFGHRPINARIMGSWLSNLIDVDYCPYLGGWCICV